ncbi:SpoIID/LytB domain-containing protein [Baekduia soli]|uniref:SpoIID/LytB domain-containing protein n=1 Tax=Baekduia soli TaxID=496014 RepID=A0A5B8U0X3_9ACTN|nr:SpoIID/LytB domain-containing protein [Baekduia soli]QEC46641.1 SpoIID/LytB domain-containing protein [Baekduia soli]
MRRIVTTSVAALLAGLACAPGAHAASRLVVQGHGFGHGIGMSQYGALGYAEHGFSYTDILSHYYEQTSVVPLASEPDVRVLLQTARRATITGAVAGPDGPLDPAKTYVATSSAGQVALATGGKRVGVYAAPLRLSAPAGGAVQLRGMAANGLRDGRYRGALEIRPAGGSVQAINAVDLEDYVRGVVSAESPANWLAEQLKAQAVVARSYAVTTNVGSTTDGIDQYADTRSQMYKGVAAEFPSTDAAVAATAGQVVAQDGKPVVTYFFSTSGGHTENVEFSFLGALPRTWLRGVDDPFDSVSPRHTWTPFTFSGTQVRQRLHGLVRGSFRGIKVLERGTSPRIVRAEVVGSNGVTEVTGPQLRQRFGLYDTWATFTYISSKVKKPATPKAPKDPKAPAVPGAPIDNGAATAGTPVDTTGGQAASIARRRPSELTGSIDRARRGRRVRIERRDGATWRTVATTRVRTGGRYRAPLPGPGEYRVAFGDIAGPSVNVR